MQAGSADKLCSGLLCFQAALNGLFPIRRIAAGQHHAVGIFSGMNRNLNLLCKDLRADQIQLGRIITAAKSAVIQHDCGGTGFHDALQIIGNHRKVITEACTHINYKRNTAVILHQSGYRPGQIRTAHNTFVRDAMNAVCQRRPAEQGTFAAKFFRCAGRNAIKCIRRNQLFLCQYGLQGGDAHFNNSSFILVEIYETSEQQRNLLNRFYLNLKFSGAIYGFRCRNLVNFLFYVKIFVQNKYAIDLFN